MTPQAKDHGLDKSDPDLQKRNQKFEQERADSRDHARQSGKGEDGNALAKPADEELPRP